MDNDDLRLSDDPEELYAHPKWLIEKFRRNFPQHWQEILKCGNEKPPLAVRVNPHRSGIADYAELLNEHSIACYPHGRDPDAPHGLILKNSIATSRLPGYSDGTVRVQDIGSQKAARLPKLRQGMRLLDACCAPGNKVSYILSMAKAAGMDSITVDCLDKNPVRLESARRNLAEQGFCAGGLLAFFAEDLADYAMSPTRNAQYDCVLLDVPCSGSGVIRRHPELKILAAEADIKKLAREQRNLFSHAWKCLKPGGELIYITCSLFAEENEEVIRGFLAKQKDAVFIPPKLTATETSLLVPRPGAGLCLLPGETNDGFFFAGLMKKDPAKKD